MGRGIASRNRKISKSFKRDDDSETKESCKDTLTRSISYDEVSLHPNFHTIDSIIAYIKRAKRIVVITGAGISVSCGIPDFRSKDVGLYNNLNCASIDIPSAELLFDLEYFMIDPAPFYKFCHILLPREEVKPSITHSFISNLQQKKKLLRNYTQNIDGLERRCGISDSKLIECHGSMSMMKCLGCKKKFSVDVFMDEIVNNNICYCKCGKVMKPMITFFGEEVPDIFNKAIELDVSKCDLVLIMGTSLKVGGSVINLLSNTQHVPHVLINRDIIPSPKSVKDFDAVLLGDCDSVTSYISQSLGWGSCRSDSDGRYRYDSEKVSDTVFKIIKTKEMIDNSISDDSQALSECKYLNQDDHAASGRSGRIRRVNPKYL